MPHASSELRLPHVQRAASRAVRLLTVAALVAGVIVAAPWRPALAQGVPAAAPEALARADFDEGVRLAREQRWPDALAAFERSRARVDRPNTALNVALALEPASDRISVIVTGGMVRPLQHSLVNPFGSLMLEQISAHLAFIGCNGVDHDRGVTNLNFAEAEVKRAMISASREVVVVADSSKLGVTEAARVCHMADVDVVVTDGSAPADLVSLLEQSGASVVLA